MHLPKEYQEWNERLTDYCLEQANEDDTRRFCLSVQQMLDENDDPSTATADFVRSVRVMYEELSSRTNDVLSLLARTSKESSRPLTIAFLGLTVLAAEMMDDLGYYRHLADLLGQPLVRNSIRAFDHLTYEQCWFELRDWLYVEGLVLELPGEKESRYVRWPKMHSLLRRVDTEKLVKFFEEKHLSPTRWYRAGYIEDCLSAWIDSGHSGFTTSGERAWKDPMRRPGIGLQVRRLLNQWDEAPYQTHNRTVSLRRTRAWLHLQHTHSGLQFTARAYRPEGYPAVLASGLEGEWRANGEYYEDLAISRSELVHLRKGIETPSGRFRVTLRGGNLFVFSPSEFGLESLRGQLRLNELCAVLCHSTIAARAIPFLQSISDAVPRTTNVGNGWVLYDSFRPVKSTAPPFGLEDLTVSANTEMQFVGGLKTGRSTWLDCAPPTCIRLTGSPIPETITIDSVSIPVHEGTVMLNDMSWHHGLHEIHAGNLNGRIIVEPTAICNITHDETDEEPVDETAIARPTESSAWWLIGWPPGECTRSEALDNLTSQTKWAIRSTSDDGWQVVAIADHRMAYIRPKLRVLSDELQWADMILRVRNPKFGSLAPNPKRHTIIPAWLSFKRAAEKLRTEHRRALVLANAQQNG